MDVTLEAKLKAHNRLGTFLVDLPALSATEGMPCVAQMRRLKGALYSTYLREQNKLAQAMARTQRDQEARENAAKAAPEGAESVAQPMSEDEENNVFQVVASMRALIQHSVIRLFVDSPDGLHVYKVSAAEAGEHGENEVSIDLLERDYGPMVNRLLVKSGLISEEPFPVGPGDADRAGPGGETVRPAAELVGEGVAGGPAV